MKAYLFPGQGAQFQGIGKELYESNDQAKTLFEQANDILGYRITDVMFNGSEEDLKQTKITQPAIFIDSIVKAKIAGDIFQPDMVGGHSLGEFSALTAAGALSFEEGLLLVQQRALAMQKACEAVEGTMAAIVGLEDEVVEEICSKIEAVVVPANYNCPKQLVISGSIEGINTAVEQANEAGALKAIVLQVGGAFHSPLMEPAKVQLQAAIEGTNFSAPICPVYQNTTAEAVTDPDLIQVNLIEQLTSPVKWTQTMRNMIANGANEFIEVGGSGKVLRGLLRRVDRKLATETL